MKTNMNTTEVKELSLTELHPFAGHPYKVRDDAEMDALVESVREHGIMVPLIVRPIDIGFEIVSGHRRAHAAMKAGLKTVPVIEVSLTRDEAAVALVDSNLNREHILPSEKAFAYKLKLEALKRQGERTDLTSVQLGQKLSRSIVAEGANESNTQIQRYIRLESPFFLYPQSQYGPPKASVYSRTQATRSSISPVFRGLNIALPRNSLLIDFF